MRFPTNQLHLMILLPFALAHLQAQVRVNFLLFVQHDEHFLPASQLVGLPLTVPLPTRQNTGPCGCLTRLRPSNLTATSEFCFVGYICIFPQSFY